MVNIYTGAYRRLVTLLLTIDKNRMLRTKLLLELPTSHLRTMRIIYGIQLEPSFWERNREQNE